MKKRINFIMLVDDNKDDNFFHERVIRKSGLVNNIIAKESTEEALEYLKKEKTDQSKHPDLILLDINMPGMNGWEFLEEYNKLDRNKQSKVVIVMLTTSRNIIDKVRAKTQNIVSDFKSKPVTIEMLHEIVEKYF